MLKTRITEQYGLKVPFINAGIFWHTKESRRRATGGPFAVVAMAGRDKSRIRIELKLHCATGALCRVFLAHVIHLTLR